MAVATAGAFAIGEYSEAATVVFLFSLSELLEAFSVARARRAIREVLDLTPETAEKITGDGKTASVPVGEISVGDLVRVKPGERIPLDGVVKKGGGSVNQAPLTGESIPVEKKPGDSVFAGTINENGVLEIAVSTIAGESKVAKIISLIEGAQQAKAPSERFVDKFAKIYTPVVFLGAIIALTVPPLLFGQAWDVWIYRALVLLVVACPCALVLATPVSIVSGLTAMARRGVLVKGGAYLEALGRLKAIAVDKTGTITEGTPKVQKVVVLKGQDEARFLEIALSIELSSSHPLALAVVNYAREKGVREIAHSDFKNIMGRGAEAVIDGHRYFLGNHRFAHELGVCTPEVESRLAELEAGALSVVVVGHAPHDADRGEVLGILGLGDTVRATAASAVKAIHAAGIETIVMLSGDNQKTATAIASQVGIDLAVGDLLPEDKVTQIKKLISERGNVAMIGDGINDAPALALASVGIAMGAAGTDTAVETADVALMKDDLSQVAVAVEQGRRALRVIQFNVGFALAIKAIFLVLAVTGYSNLWFAVLADTGASILVIANAMRLLKVSASKAA
jgi:Zn2+/Cd2+-exporting ATPase